MFRVGLTGLCRNPCACTPFTVLACWSCLWFLPNGPTTPAALASLFAYRLGRCRRVISRVLGLFYTLPLPLGTLTGIMRSMTTLGFFTIVTRMLRRRGLSGGGGWWVVMDPVRR